MDVSRYLDGWRERARRDEERRAGAEARARAALPEAVEILRAHGATRVWLIGSLARGTFELRSDVDLLVAGLDERAAWRAAAEASNRTGVAVDVVRAESLSASWRDYHERHGERLHG